MKLPGLPYIAGGALLVGSIGGWTVRTWKTNSDHKAELEQTVDAYEKTLADQIRISDGERMRADRLNEDLQRARMALDSAVQANAVLAASRASTTTRIIENGEQIGRALQDDNTWIRYEWPRELLLYANGDNTAGPMPATEGAGYR